MDVLFEVSFNEKDLCRRVKRIEDRERLFIERIHDALSRKELQEVKLKRAGEHLDANAVLCRKIILNVLRKRIFRRRN